MPKGEREKSRIATTYEPVQPTYAQATTRPAPQSRIRKPSLDEMTVGRTEVPVQKAIPPKPAAPPTRTIEIESDGEKKARRGRPRRIPEELRAAYAGVAGVAAATTGPGAGAATVGAGAGGVAALAGAGPITADRLGPATDRSRSASWSA